VDTVHTSIEKSPVTKNKLNSGSALCFKYVTDREYKRTYTNQPTHQGGRFYFIHARLTYKLGNKNTKHLIIYHAAYHQPSRVDLTRSQLQVHEKGQSYLTM